MGSLPVSEDWTLHIKLVAHVCVKTLKVPIMTKADNNFILLFSDENKSWYFMWIVCKQTIHTKYQDLFSLKNKKKKKILECRLLQILLGSLKVNPLFFYDEISTL